MGRWTIRRGDWLLAAAAAAMVTVLLVDGLSEGGEFVTPYAVLAELVDIGLVVGSAVASALLAQRLQAQREESQALREDIEAVRAESRRWREEMADQLRALGAAIRRQFDTWHLTPAEQEVGLLLLKGLSHKEIARLRRTSEATIRQQAASVYQKAGLSGRAALAAFFLDGLRAEPWPAEESRLRDAS